MIGTEAFTYMNSIIIGQLALSDSPVISTGVENAACGDAPDGVRVDSRTAVCPDRPGGLSSGMTASAEQLLSFRPEWRFVPQGQILSQQAFQLFDVEIEVIQQLRIQLGINFVIVILLEHPGRRRNKASVHV